MLWPLGKHRGSSGNAEVLRQCPYAHATFTTEFDGAEMNLSIFSVNSCGEGHTNAHDGHSSGSCDFGVLLINDKYVELTSATKRHPSRDALRPWRLEPAKKNPHLFAQCGKKTFSAPPASLAVGVCL